MPKAGLLYTATVKSNDNEKEKKLKIKKVNLHESA